jgi:DNA-binding response OmpR family regulator
MPDSATILLVDDEESVRKLLTYPLERDGYRVVQARDGDEALSRFDAEDVDLVVLDVMIPKIDGLEVCKRLRARSAVPIVMLTARDDELDKVLGLELGPTTTSPSRSRSASSAAGSARFCGVPRRRATSRATR